MFPWEERFAAGTAGSHRLHKEAAAVLAGGVTHDVRHARPYPLAVDHARGARKWDVDGNAYVDYVMGHGSLLLGHGNPAVVAAVRDQARRGTHYGAAHEAEVEWGRLVCELVPSAARVRFTSSGTEAVLLAVRLARAFTGRCRVAKLPYHFHGWSEVGVLGLDPGASAVPGVSVSAASEVVVLPPDEPERIRERLDRRDVAAVLVEPSGGHFGQLPCPAGLLRELATACLATGTLLVFDEVVTGFRWAPGGAQERFGIFADLTTLAKVLGGGLPAGAVAGRADVLELLEVRGEPAWDGSRHVYHPGTFNANPLSAAAGIAALRQVAARTPVSKAERAAGELRDALADRLAARGVAGAVYGEASTFHIYLGPAPAGPAELAGMRGPLGAALRTAMLAQGVDLLGPGGFVSSVHGPEEIDRTVAAFDRALDDLAAAGLVTDR